MFFAFIFCKHKNGGCMNDILRAVVQSGVFPELLEEKRVTFEKIPAESEALYDADIQRLRQVTEVITTNSDSDKEQGLLIYNLEKGSCGEGRAVIQTLNGKYRKIGEVFGILYKLGNGLII